MAVATSTFTMRPATPCCLSSSRAMGSGALSMGLPVARKANGGAKFMAARAEAATLDVHTFDGKTNGKAVLDLKTARPETATAVVHRKLVLEMQNLREGNSSTLTKGEVRGGGRKPTKQKGLGRARRGSNRTPLKVGGGITFGPKPRDWTIRMNKKEKRLAFSTALQSATSDMVVVEDFDAMFTAPKTKDVVSALSRWGIAPESHVLLITNECNDHLALSTRNLAHVTHIDVAALSVYDVLRADRVVVTKNALADIQERYGAEEEAAA